MNIKLNREELDRMISLVKERYEYHAGFDRPADVAERKFWKRLLDRLKRKRQTREYKEVDCG